MKGKILLVLSAVVIFSLGTLVSASIAQEEEETMTLDEYLEGATVLCEGKKTEVELDGIAAVVLEENLSTGYRWEYVVEPEGALVEMEKRSFQKGEKKLMGAPKMAAWKFSPKLEGKAKLTFRYLRPWEGEEGVAETIVFKVKVVE
jgi:predicted secreted protein